MVTLSKPLSIPNVASHSANNFDFLRFLFAAVVILSHSFILGGAGAGEPLTRLSGGQVYLGELAVNGFFAISGFLITASWMRRPQWGDYLRKRVLRIYPGFLVVCVLCAFLVGTAGAAAPMAYLHQIQPARFLLHLLLLDKISVPHTFPHNPVPDEVNGSLWTIKIEFEFYLMVAVLGSLRVFRNRALPLALTAGSLLLCALIHVHGFAGRLPETFTEHLRFLTYFLTGMTFFLYRDWVPYRLAWVLCALAVLAVATWTHTLEVFMPLPLTYLLMAVAFSPGIRLHRFGQRRDISYGLYLYAWPIQQLLVQHGVRNPWVLFLTALPLTALAATLSWHLIEKPCLRLKPKSNPQLGAVRPEDQNPQDAREPASGKIGATVGPA